jgi:SNF family Na+-dependent transporter
MSGTIMSSPGAATATHHVLHPRCSCSVKTEERLMSASAMPIHHMSLVLAAIITNASGLTSQHYLSPSAL